MSIPINQQNSYLLDLMLKDIRKKMDDAVKDLVNRQQKELLELISNFDTQTYVERAFKDITHTEVMQTIMRNGAVAEVKFILDINGDHIDQTRVEL